MSKKILVVDNNPVILKIMMNFLEKEGHHVMTADDGLAALEILRTHVPDVIFTDMVMPIISGRKLCEIIRSQPQLKDVYIVIFSAIAKEEEIDPAEFGANACIAKGAFSKIPEYVIESLKLMEQNGSTTVSKKIIGAEEVYPREIVTELLRSRRHFELILENMSDGIFEITPTGEITYANPAATALAGIPEVEMLTKKFIDLF